MSSNKTCPLGGFCWKNPVHLALFFAVLPFTVKGIGLVWDSVAALINPVVSAAK
jgi:hypothetical protein